MRLLLPFLAPMDVPVGLGRAGARDAVREELAKQVYRAARPGLLERLIDWAGGKLGRLLELAAGSGVGGGIGSLVIVALVVLAAVGLRRRLGPMGRASRSEQLLFLGRERTAAEHRAAADRHAASGEWAEAVRERLRAVIRSLEERVILDPRPGRTADEAAAEAGAALPGCAADLWEAARLFDEIWYGGRIAVAAADARLRELDQRVSTAR